MAKITQIENSQLIDRNQRAEKLVKDAKLLNFAKLANILIDLFGLNDAFQRIGDREGQEVEMEFPSLGGSLTYTLVSNKEKFECRYGRAKDPIAIIVFNVKKENTIKLLSKIIRLKDNLFGIMRILPKYLTRKIKIKGSLISSIKLCRCLMIGKNKMYTRGKK